MDTMRVLAAPRLSEHLMLRCRTAQTIMKQLLKPFKPAEPRFEGLSTEVSEHTGAAVLLDSAAYLECTVQNRLEVRHPARVRDSSCVHKLFQCTATAGTGSHGRFRCRNSHPCVDEHIRPSSAVDTYILLCGC